MVIRDRSGKFQTVKPCNCGSTDLGFYYSMHDGEPHRTAVMCERCRDMGPTAGGQNEEEAARLWNAASGEADRKPDAALKADCAVLRDAVEYAHSQGFEWPSDPLAHVSKPDKEADK